LNKILAEKARIHNLNSILDYLEAPNWEEPDFSVKPFSTEKELKRARRELNPGPPDVLAILFRA
jgi:hypothetical protein